MPITIPIIVLYRNRSIKALAIHYVWVIFCVTKSLFLSFSLKNVDYLLSVQKCSSVYFKLFHII